MNQPRQIDQLQGELISWRESVPPFAVSAEEVVAAYNQGKRDFSGLQIPEADLFRAELPGIVLAGASLNGADFTEALHPGAKVLKTVAVDRYAVGRSVFLRVPA